MKKNICLFLSVFIIILCSFCERVDANEKDVEPIRIGFLDNTQLIKISDEGKYYGYGIEYLNYLSNYLNRPYEVYFGNKDDLTTMLDNGELDTICMIQDNNYIQTEKSIGYANYVLLSEENSNYYLNDYSEFDKTNIRIGYLEDDSIYGLGKTKPFLKSMAKSFDFNCSTIEFSNSNTMIESLYDNCNGKKKIDAFFTNSLTNDFNTFGLKVVANFGSCNYYFNFDIDNYDLKNQFDLAMERLKSVYPHIYKNLHENYFSSAYNIENNFERSEIEYMNVKKEIKVAIPKNYPPFSYKLDGKLKGIYIDILNTIDDMLPMKFEFVLVHDSKDAYKKLKEHKVDMIAGVVTGTDMSKFGDVNLSTSIFDLRSNFYYKKGFDFNFDNFSKVAVTNKNLGVVEFLKIKNANFDFIICNSDKECLDAVKNNQADVALVYEMLTEKWAFTHGYTDLDRFYDPILYGVSFGISTNGEHELVHILNKIIYKIPKAKMNQIIISNRYYEGESDFLDIFYRYPVQAIISILIIISLIVSYIFTIYSTHIKDRQRKALEEKNKELAIAIVEAKEATKSKSDFFSRISHEIRTPMNIIMGMSTIATEHSQNSAYIIECMEKIKDSSKYLMMLINDILDISRFDNNKIKLVDDIFPLKESLTFVETLMEERAKSEKIKLTFEYKVSEEYIIGDSLRINQILINLVANAINYTEEGGRVHVTIREVSKDSSNIIIYFSVIDNGIGIAKNNLNKIFMLFEQENRIKSRSKSGTGLGLVICKNLVELMDSEIRVYSEIGKGSEFTFSVNFKLPTKEEVNDVIKSINKSLINQFEEEKTDFLPMDFSKYTVLIVDDNDINLEIIVALLKKTNIKMITAKNGKEAYEIFNHTREDEIDIILMDILMPVIDGYEAAKMIRKLPREDSKKVPIIAMTAYVYVEDIQKATMVGMDGHISKPISIHKLQKIIQENIGK